MSGGSIREIVASVRSKRFTLKTAMAFVAVVALGLASIRVASDIAASMIGLLLLLVVLTGLLGTVISRFDAGWLGFAMFSTGYLFVQSFVPQLTHFGAAVRIGHEMVVEAIADLFHPTEFPIPPAPSVEAGYMNAIPRSGPMGQDLYNWLVSSNDYDFVDTSSLSSKSRTALKAYQDEARSHANRVTEARRQNSAAREIASHWLVILVGLLGSWLGRILSILVGPKSRAELASPDGVDSHQG